MSRNAITCTIMIQYVTWYNNLYCNDTICHRCSHNKIPHNMLIVLQWIDISKMETCVKQNLNEFAKDRDAFHGHWLTE